jgi:hypothetical protein
MTTISRRYLGGLALLLALALVPTVLHTYIGFTTSDGKTSRTVPVRLKGDLWTDTGRNADWVHDNFASDDFIERRFERVTLFVARSYDPKSLYHHPELGLAYGRTFDPVVVSTVPSAAGPIPLHVLKGEDQLAVYALLYDGRFIADPVRFQLANAFAMLVSPRRQMTLFFAHGDAAAEPLRSAVARSVLAAAESFVQDPAAAP